MGCCASLQPASKAALLKERGGSDFRDVYVIGARLGEGAFGTVFECRKRISSDKKTYAVKMMEHQSSWWGRFSSSQEAQWQMFAQEFNMLKTMEHPNLIKMQGIFIDDYFVYFVMDKYSCNLINAVLPHLKKGGSKSSLGSALGEIMAQLLRSILYMHSRQIVHRDVKADNFLVDGLSFKREFRVVLTDLSTARHLEDGVFLSDVVGTKEYWAPELVARSYAHKVDVWAIGVIFWCMLTMKFPFATVQERFTKKLVKEERMTGEQFELMQGLMEKNPAHRMSAKEAAQNSWVLLESEAHHHSLRVAKRSSSVADTASTTDVEIDTDGADGKAWGQTRQGAQEGGGDGDRLLEKMRLADERFNLGERVAVTLEEKLRQGKTQVQGDKISVTDRQRVGETKTYEWWSEVRCVEKQVPDIDTPVQKDEGSADANFASMCAGDVVVGEPANAEYLEHLFEAHNIDLTNFGVGDAKNVSDLFAELGKHECCLLMRDGRLIRIVDLVVLRIVSDEGKILVEAEQRLPDGRRREVQRLPAVMCRAKGRGRESALLEVSRILATELRTSSELLTVDMNPEQEEVMTEMLFSQSYPGLETIYRRFIFNGRPADGAPEGKLAALGLPAGDKFSTSLQDGTGVAWEWWPPERCRAARIPVEPEFQTRDDFEGFQRLMGQSWTEDMLRALLRKHKIEVELFGVGQARTIEQLASEVNSGETVLYEKPSCAGELRRYLEILIVRIKNSLGAFFIETAHSFGRGLKRERNLFPATKVRPYEDKIWAVRRLLCELDIPFANAKTCFGPRRIEQSTSPSYPNIVTVYLKQVVEVQLEELDVANLDVDQYGGAAKWYLSKQKAA